MTYLPSSLAIMLLFSSCAVADNSSIEFSELEPVYENTQPVTVTLTNVGKREVKIYSNLEVLEDRGGRESWVTWPFRVEDGDADSIPKTYVVAPHKKITITFDITKIDLPPIPAGGGEKVSQKLTFRFRGVIIGSHENGKDTEFFSKAFLVNHPYKGRDGR